jgi:mono/diheme cytochrome c family protein
VRTPPRRTARRFFQRRHPRSAGSFGPIVLSNGLGRTDGREEGILRHTRGPRYGLVCMMGLGLIAADGHLASLAAEGAREPSAIYATTCGYCHGANVGPIILGRHLPAASIEAVVRHGPNAMPAFRPTEVTDAELHALARWIESSAAATTEHGQ